jgi:hypothetical protein
MGAEVAGAALARIEYHKVMATITKTLYDTDFAEWTAHTAELLRQGKFDEVDLEHVLEEIEDLGKSAFRAAESQVRCMLVHLIKQKIRPERDGAGWQGSIANAQEELLAVIRDSPSLRRRLSGEIARLYTGAVRIALLETGSAGVRGDLGIPDRCPFTLSQLMDGDPGSLRF